MVTSSLICLAVPMISVEVSVYLSVEPSFTAIVNMLFCVDGVCD